MRSASKKSNKEIDEASSKKKRKRETPAPEPAFKHQPVDQRIAEKRARAAERAGKPVPQEDDEEERDFASVTRVGVNDVAEAPPSLDKFIKMQKSVGPSGNNKGGSRVGLSLAQQEALEQQRQEAILRQV